MQTTSSMWNSLLESGKVEFKAIVNSVEYTYANIAEAKISCNLFGQSFSLGNACSSTLEMTFKPEGTIPTMAQINCYVRLTDGLDAIFVVDEDGNRIMTVDGYALVSQYPSTSEWLPFGVFYIDTREIDKWGWMRITAYDAMLMSEIEYWDNNGTYPMSMSNAVNYICQQLGWEQDSRNSYSSYTIDYPAGIYTMREVLKFIAAANGGNFIIGPDGKLRLVKIGSPVTTEKETLCSDVSWLTETAISVSRVSLYPDENTMYTSGDDTGYDLTGESAYATQAMANALKTSLGGITYLPYSANDAIINPALELGDTVKIDGKISVLASAVYTISAGLVADISAPLDMEINHEYQYAEKTRSERILARSYSEIRKTTEEIALEVAGKLDEKEAQNLIDISLEDGITLSSTSGTNGATVSIKYGNVTIDSETVKVNKIDADLIDVVNLNADNITAGELSADYIKLGGEMTIYRTLSSNTVGGYIGYGTGYSGDDGALLSNGYNDCYFIATSSGVRMEGEGNYVYCSSGNVGASQAITVGSDRRLKTEINYDLSSYEQLFSALQPCSYFYTRDLQHRHLGFIAQDVDESRAALGMHANDLAAVAQPEKEDGYYGISYSEFVPLLVHMLQKLYGQVDTLQAKVNELESKING